MRLTIKSLTATLKKQGYPLFTGDLNVTLVGGLIRCIVSNDFGSTTSNTVSFV